MSFPRVTLHEVAAFERPVKLRLPFRFGDAEVHETSEAYLRVLVEVDGKRVTGHGAQLMVPRWFDKRAELDNAATVEELRQTLRVTLRRATGQSGTVAAIGRALRPGVLEAMPSGTPALAAGFGPALLEMALIDAVCRAVQLPFPDAVRRDLFGLAETGTGRLPAEAIRKALAGIAPVSSIAVRHTVGYGSPLEAAEGRSGGRPTALAEVLAAWGVRFLKIKLKGNPEADLAWLRQIAALLARAALRPGVTLDANEQYGQADFMDFLEGFRADPALAELRAGLLYVEQPFDRAVTLAPDGPRPPSDVKVIIDEADDTDTAFETALDRGFSGTSVKSCKGVLRALRNFALARLRASEGQAVLIASEDLTCQPGLCWQQDTLMAATLGLEHSERNGHYFAGGFQGAPEGEVAGYLAQHPEIYCDGPEGPELRIRKGRVGVASLYVPGFGSTPGPDLSAAAEIASS